MPCSARLPVYTLLIAIFIPRETVFGGLIGWQGLTLFAIYVFGMAAGLVIAGLVNRWSPSEGQMPFMMELPAYRIPALVPIARKSVQRAQHFVIKAGAVILGVTVVIWILGYFLIRARFGRILAGHAGAVDQPVFQPLGLDWRYGVAIVGAFLRKSLLERWAPSWVLKGPGQYRAAGRAGAGRCTATGVWAGTAGLFCHCPAVCFHRVHSGQRGQVVELGAAHGDRLPVPRLASRLGDLSDHWFLGVRLALSRPITC